MPPAIRPLPPAEAGRPVSEGARTVTRTLPAREDAPMSDYAVINPATGETLKTYPTISDDDLRDAIARADKAHREWTSSTTVEERAALIRRVGELHNEHS